MVEEYSVIFCTVPSQEIGMNIAEDLVAGRFAACVNIVPGITSVYRWKGDVCHDNEFLLMIKSRTTLFKIIRDRITTLHPYEVPEIISCSISEATEKYINWMAENTLSQ
jgi:periplasmic divalent cation tolerance protein